MKKVMVRFLWMLSISLVVIVAVACQSANNNSNMGDMRSHLMVNNQLYWSSAYPVDNLFSESEFVCIGEVEEEVHSTPTANFQAYNIASGTKIYYSHEFPRIAYVESSTIPYRFATAEASIDYLFYESASLCIVGYTMRLGL